MNLKSALVGSAAASALALAAPAQAETSYISIFGGVNSLLEEAMGFGPYGFSTTVNSGTGYGTSYSVLALTSYSGIYSWTFNAHSTGGATAYWYTAHSTHAGTNVGAFEVNDFSNGFVVGLALGRNLGNGMRAELELAYRKNDIGGPGRVDVTQNVSSYYFGSTTATGHAHLYVSGSYSYNNTFTAPPLHVSHYGSSSSSTAFQMPATGSGEITTYSFMANIWQDFDLGIAEGMTPFVGAGIGLVNMEVDYSGQAVLPTNTLWGISTVQNTMNFGDNERGLTFGVQAAAGVAFEAGNGMRFTAQYRYFATGGIRVGNSLVSVKSNELLVGLSFPFGG